MEFGRGASGTAAVGIMAPASGFGFGHARLALAERAIIIVLCVSPTE